jgi:hypothetical protein
VAELAREMVRGRAFQKLSGIHRAPRVACYLFHRRRSGPDRGPHRLVVMSSREANRRLREGDECQRTIASPSLPMFTRPHPVERVVMGLRASSPAAKHRGRFAGCEVVSQVLASMVGALLIAGAVRAVPR